MLPITVAAIPPAQLQVPVEYYLWTYGYEVNACYATRVCLSDMLSIKKATLGNNISHEQQLLDYITDVRS